MQQNHVVFGILVIAALVLMKGRRRKEAAARLKKGPPPAWASHLVPLVPEWLHNGLNWYDWDAMRRVHPMQLDI